MDGKQRIKEEVYKDLGVESSLTPGFNVLLGKKLFENLSENDFDPERVVNGENNKYLVFGLPSFYINKYLTEGIKLKGVDLIVMSSHANDLEKCYNDKRKKIEYELYDKLSRANSKEKIVSLIDHAVNGVFTDINRIYTGILDYVVSKNVDNEERDNIFLWIKDNLAIYTKVKNEEMAKVMEKLDSEKDKSLLGDARKLLFEYMNSDYDNRIGFCTDRNIDLAYFDKLLNVVEKYDYSLYEEYEMFVKEKRHKQIEDVVGNFKTIVNGITNGVEENGKVRSYDLLDYSLATNLNFEDFQTLCREANLKGDRFRKVRAFVAKNMNVGSKKTKTVLDEKLIIGNKEISMEEKEYVLSYLKKHHVAFNEKVYMLALRRYLNGTLDVEEQKIKKNKESKIKK